jgi:hypothetical protein
MTLTPEAILGLIAVILMIFPAFVVVIKYLYRRYYDSSPYNQGNPVKSIIPCHPDR